MPEDPLLPLKLKYNSGTDGILGDDPYCEHDANNK